MHSAVFLWLLHLLPNFGWTRHWSIPVDGFSGNTSTGSMSAPGHGGIFLSYAREDSDAAHRIADGLSAFGLEVWLDQSELRGGDAWDASIRQKIRSCALFVPLISAQTQNRREGYFRREWNLAVERTLDMAPGSRFLLPVAIDDTPEAGAAVPEPFLRVHWSRVPKGVATPKFIEQVRRLLEPKGESSPTALTSNAAGGDQTSRHALKWVAGAILILALAAAGWWKVRPNEAISGPVPAAGNPVIVLMDTPYPDRVYDPATLKSGGTNADDITDLLRDLPVTIVKEATSSQWQREREVIEQHPSLIVMHRSCFFTFPETRVEELYPLLDNKLVAFIGHVATVNPQTRFIIYSRHSWEDAKMAAKWRDDAAARFPALAGKIETYRVPLDRATFRNPLTGQELKDAVVRQLGISH
jgi:hypothetical protein